jgi:TetR/AcrR family transcriptional regulator
MRSAAAVLSSCEGAHLLEVRETIKRDSRLTRQRIIVAATKEFASKGLEGARVDEIAVRSRANKSLIYDYYESKQGLFQAVLEEMFRTIRSRQGDSTLKHLSPVTGLRTIVESMFDVLHEFPDFVSLLQSENLAKAEHVRSSTEIMRLYHPVTKTLKAMLRRGVREGVFRRSLNPLDLYVSIAALATFDISNRYTLSAVFGTDIGAARAVRRRRAHIVDMVLRYVLK